MKWYKNRNTPQFERFAKYVFGLSSADDGIAALEKWFEEIGTPTRLEQLNIRKQIWPLSLRTSRSMSKRLVLPVITRRKL
jgi:alcohol dehydrogenase YqhD (iron-dependent ADH family)